MKVITVSENQVVYVGNGQTTSFGYNFKILNRSDLHLIRVDTNGNETAVTSDYYIHLDTSIVDYPGYAPGAEEPEVDRPLVLGRGEKLVIYRDVPITQESQMPTQWPFDVIEDAHDKSCMIDQQLQGQLDRSLKVARSQWTSDFNPTLPVQAGYGWRVSDDGKSIIALANPEGIYEQCEGLKSDVAAMKEATNSLLGLTQTAANTATAAASSANSAKTSAQASATAAANSAYDAGSKATIVESYYTNVAQAYDETEEYSAGDLVFVSNGDMYRALVDVSGEAPGSGYSWTKVQSNLMLTFEMDAAGDLMPRTAPQTSSIWDIDQNGDITPTAYGSGSETHGAEEQIIENQRNIAKLDATKADKTEIVDAYSKSEIDVQFATVNGDISELNSDIANRVAISQGEENDGKYLVVGSDGNVTLGDGAGGGSEKKFELLNDITLTEEAVIILSADDNGNAYNLDSFFMVINPPSVPTVKQPYIQVEYLISADSRVSLVNLNSYTIIANNKNYIDYINNNGIRLLRAYNVWNGAIMGSRNTDVDMCTNSINRIVLGQSAFPVGTTIKVYGVKL